jgi:hypothetical protein
LNGYRNTPLFASSSRSLMPVSNGLEIYPNFYELNCADPLPVGQACRLLDSPERSPFWSCRFDRITNHESLLTNHPSTRSPALGGSLTFHILPSALTAHHQSPITNHQYSHGRASGLRSASSWPTLLSASRSAMAQRFEGEPENAL